MLQLQRVSALVRFIVPVSPSATSCITDSQHSRAALSLSPTFCNHTHTHTPRTSVLSSPIAHRHLCKHKSCTLPRTTRNLLAWCTDKDRPAQAGLIDLPPSPVAQVLSAGSPFPADRFTYHELPDLHDRRLRQRPDTIHRFRTLLS